VPKTTLNPCQQDSDCQPDADHGPRATGISNSTGVQTGFQCIEVRPQERRCVKPCEKNSDCRAGHVCEEVAAFLPNVATSLCVEAPPIDTDCFPQPMTAYSVRAGHSFVVTGSSLPRLHTTQVAADGTCQLVPNADPSLVNRIPLSAPQCPDSFLAQAHPEVTDLETGTVKSPEVFVQNLPAQAGFNPCLYRSPQHDGAGTSSGGVRAFFQNPQIRFVLANLDTYAGDLLAIHFELQYGFVPQVVQIPSYEVLLTMGTRIVVGPTKTPESPIRKDPDKTIFYPYLYVVDQGATALTPGSKGQVLRINPRAQNNEIVSFDTTYSGSTPFQLQ
jgi:hypothetical protein